MRTYQEVLAELRAAGITARFGDFYEYEGFPLEEEFKRFFEVAQDFLDREDLGFDVKPAFFYYNTTTTVNAIAYTSNDIYIIELFKGTLYTLYDYYTSREDVFQHSPFEKYKVLMDKHDISGSYVLFQFVMLFILFHEIGHLIQRHAGASDYIEFVTGHVPGYSVEERHMREHDADWFGAGQIVFHAIDFLKTEENLAIDVGELNTILEMAAAAIYMYYIRQAEQKPELYFAEFSHPHPTVRISYIIMYFLDTVHPNVEVAFNPEEVLRNAIRLAEALLMEQDRNIVEDFSMNLFDRSQEIEDYINKIRKDSEAYPHLAHKKLNTGPAS